MAKNKESKFDKVVTMVKGYKAKADKYYKDHPEVSKAVDIAIGASIGGVSADVAGGTGPVSKVAAKFKGKYGLPSKENLIKRTEMNRKAPIKKERLAVEKYNKETQRIKNITKNRNKSDTDYQEHVKEWKYKDKLNTIKNKGSSNPDDFGWKGMDKKR